MKVFSKLLMIICIAPSIGHAQIFSLGYGHENVSRFNDGRKHYNSSGTAEWYDAKIHYGNNFFIPLTYIEYDNTVTVLQTQSYALVGAGYSFNIDSLHSLMLSASFAQESVTYSDRTKGQRDFYLTSVEYHYARRTMDYFRYNKMDLFYRSDLTQDQGRKIYSQAIGLIISLPIMIPDIGIGLRYGTKDSEFLNSTPDIQSYGAFIQVSF